MSHQRNKTSQLLRSSRLTCLASERTAGETGTTTGSRTATPGSSGRPAFTTPTTKRRSFSVWPKPGKLQCFPGNDGSACRSVLESCRPLRCSWFHLTAGFGVSRWGWLWCDSLLSEPPFPFSLRKKAQNLSQTNSSGEDWATSSSGKSPNSRYCKIKTGKTLQPLF